MLIVLAMAFTCVTLSLSSTCSEIALQGLNNEMYAAFGDINIGGLFSITDYGKGTDCSTKIRKPTHLMEFVEAVVFAVQKVNDDNRLLPNFDLGFVILDYCRKHNTAVARSLSFLPGRTDHRCQTTERTALGNQTMDYYDVIGVIGLFSSLSTTLVSNLYAVAKLPLLSFLATSDLLSDKSTHPYFLRVVPPDVQQVLAMLAFIANNEWSYVSIVYEEGTYGQNAFEHFRRFSADFGVCFAYVQKVGLQFNSDKTVKHLLAFPNARVVILFSNILTSKKVLKSSSRLGVKGHFIWIGSDGLRDKLIHEKEIHEELIGSFLFMSYTREVEEFAAYFNDIKVSSSKNPWLKRYWEYHGKCSFDNGSCAHYRSPSDFQGFKNSTSASLVIDSVLTFAHATHRLIKDMCPFARRSDLNQCIQGEMLMKYLLATSFDGYTGRIKFDENGDFMGEYEIRQVKEVIHQNENSTVADVLSVEEPIAVFDIATRKIIYNSQPISWGHLSWGSANRRNETISGKPSSLCSKPCGLGQYRVQLDVACCWECRRCRNNERVAQEGGGCETCGEFTWPDPATNLTTCLPISIEFSSLYSTVPMVEIFLALVDLLILVAVIYFYCNNRDNRVIKASSRELSYLQMTGIMLGYISVIVFQLKPDDLTCGCLYFMYCLSFTWLYSPLIVKTVRIYRIFNSAQNNKRPRFTSPKLQLLFATILIAIQVIICIVVYIVYKPRPKRNHPNPMEKFVELSCDMTLPGLASFLAYNLFLVALCSYFAFKTRKLPENFNESLFISMCVSTTLIIWLSVIATFLTATRDDVRVLLLSMSLLLNHTVAIVFLFIPKIYAVMVVDPLSAFTFSPSSSPHLNASSMSKNLLSIGHLGAAKSAANQRRSSSDSALAGMPRRQSHKPQSDQLT